MKLRILTLIAALLASSAWSQALSSRPITFVVPALAGGATDVIARALAQQMSQQMGQTIIVENRPGAGGTLAAMAVAQAAPDGHTLLVTHSGPLLTAPHVIPNVRYDPRRDFAFITQLCTGSLVLAVNAAVPATNMKEFVSWAQKNKGKLSYGSYGVGSSGHLLSAYLDQSLKLEMSHVPYKAEAALLQDLAGGQVPWGIATSGALAPHVASGRIRLLAILGDRRLPEFPQVPTMKEAGYPDPEYKPVGWAAVVAPAATPAAIVARLEKEARAAVQTPAMKARFQVFGMYALGTSAEEFRRDFDTSAPIVERMVKASGAKAD